MAYDDDFEPDDEDWCDNDDGQDDEEPARCPECGGQVSSVTDKCPACGYWLSNADRRNLWTSESKPTWIRLTAAIVLASILLSMIAYGVAFF